MTAAYLQGPAAAPRNGGHSSCTGKHGYKSANLAVAQAQRIGARIQHYRCLFCGLWHIGKAGGGQINKARAVLIRREAAP